MALTNKIPAKIRHSVCSKALMGCKTRGVGWAGEKCGIAKDSCIAAMAPVTRNKLKKRQSLVFCYVQHTV